MESALKDLLTGAVLGASPACSAGQNLVPLGSCGIQCPDGKFSSKPGNTHKYSCPVKGKPATPPTIVCTTCGVPNCGTCPSNPLCDTCKAGFVLASDKKSCVAKACPTPAAQPKITKVNTGVAGKTEGNLKIFHQGPEQCADVVMATSSCQKDYFSYNTRSDGNCICKADANALVVRADAKADYYKIEADPAGACVSCPLGTAGTVTWNAVTSEWDTSPCDACTISNCADCKGNKAECIVCASGYAVKDATKKECVKIPDCPYGTKGSTFWNQVTGKEDITNCATDTTKCEDTSQTAGACTDCKDGFAGSVDWDFVGQKWNKDQCHAVACPRTDETTPSCTKCPEFQTGTPVWDDLFNQWAGCVANDFGFSGPSASWAGTVSADINEMYVIESKSAEQLHVQNSQYDAIAEQWVCDEGYAGEGCKQRLCPETVAFTSGVDGFTPSKSTGVYFSTDAGSGTSSTFNNQHSYRECGGRGTCDFETGLCQCFPGFTGVGCRRTTCPNSCSGHGVCMNDDISNYHAAGGASLPAVDVDVNTWGNLWASDKFQGCRCDGGWGGNDCSLRQCPRGDDPETQCTEDLGNDIQYIECTKLVAIKEHFFKLRFTDLLGNRYSTRAVVIRPHEGTLTDVNRDALGAAYVKSAAHSIQTALESLPNFAVPKVEVTASQDLPAYSCNTKNVCEGKKKAKTCKDVTTCDYAQPYTLKFEIKFTDPRNSGEQSLMELQSDMKCDTGVQPMFKNEATFDPACTVTRRIPPADEDIELREKWECANRGLCNRKTAECNCFDGYTGLACDIIAQTY